MSSKTSLVRSLLLAGLVLAASGPALASPPSDGAPGLPPDGEGPGRARHRPPPFAYEACEGKSADAACTVELPDVTVDGKCVPDENDALFCRPEHMPPPPAH